jgi:hypothetical protein
VKTWKRARGILTFAALVLFMAPSQTEANSFAGMRYNIYLYNSDIASANLSFEANLSVFIDAYNGFGFYLPMGTVFAASYWSPNYNKTKDLFLLMSGMVAADYIWGWGLSFPDYRLNGMFFFSGYAATR